jgi:type I restriction enzyme S subunit
VTEFKFDLPPGWAWSTLGEIGVYQNGRAFKKSEWATNGRPIIRIQDLTGTGSSPNYFDGTVESRYEVSKGDLLVSWAATLGVYVWNGEDAVLNQHIFKVQSFINPQFHFYLLRFALAELERQAHGTGMVHITKGKFDSTTVAVPPLLVQRKIVEFLDKTFSCMDAAVTSLRLSETRLKGYRGAVLKAACEGRLVPTEAQLARVGGREFELAESLLRNILAERRAKYSGARYRDPSPPELPSTQFSPEGWCYASLEQLTDPARVICYGILMPKEHIPSGVPYVRVLDMKYERIDVRSLKRTSSEISGQYARASLRTGDLLLSIRGTYGRVAKVPPELSGGNITQDTARLALSESVDSDYIAIHLRNPSSQQRFKQVSRGVAVKGVNIADVRTTPILLPPLAEQRRIVAEVQRRLSVLQEVETSVRASLLRAEGLRRSILQDAFEGRLALQDPADEPVAVLLERIHQSRESATESRPRRGRGIKGGASIRALLISPDPGILPRKGQRHVAWGASPRKGTLNQTQSPEGAAADQRSGKARRRPFRAQDLVSDRIPGADAPGYMPLPLTGQDAGPDFLSRSRAEQIDAVWNALLGRGPLEKEEAVRTAAQFLRDQGIASFRRLRQGGSLWEAVASAIDRGAREGSFDRPRRGHVRALLLDARTYTPEIWRRCLLDSLDHAAIEEDQALRDAADRARESLGLEFERLREDGVILRGLRAALQEAVRTGEIRKERGKIIKASSHEA